MKTRDFLLGMLACFSLGACSSENVVNNDVLTGGDSYVSIRLVTSNGDLDSRGSVGTGDSEFAIGTTAEATVTNSHFYFYDNDGNYVTKGETVSSIANTYPTETGGNEETRGTVNVVLRNVTSIPAYVLVVLNMNEGNADGKFKESLTKSYQALAESENGYGYTVTNAGGSTTYFTMTNSTYIDGSNVVCATPLSTNHLQKTEDLAEANPITIHVERMAAKVCLSDDSAITGHVNAQVLQDSESSSTEKQLTINVKYWGVNAVNKSSFYMKAIENTWDYNWWKPTETYYRTYWAKDPNYLEGYYPTSAENHATATNWSLKYYTANEIEQAYNNGAAKYCLENTLGENLLVDNGFMTKATSVVVVAEMKIGDTAEDLFIYKGVIYDKDNYIKVALSDLTASYKIYKSTDGSTFTEIATSDVEIKSLTDGKITLALTTEASASTWYDKEDGSGNQISNFNDIFATLNEADGYKNGLMYYSIPIEHLARTTVTSPYQVGDYGIVRNHVYQIKINKIENLGKGIYDSDEVIVPNYDPETYFVAAELHILSWKTVNQSVDL